MVTALGALARMILGGAEPDEKATPASADSPPEGTATTDGDVVTTAADLAEKLLAEGRRLLEQHWGDLLWVAVVVLIGLFLGRVLRRVFERFATRFDKGEKPIRAVALRSLAATATWLSFAVGLLVALNSVAANTAYQGEVSAVTSLVLLFATSLLLYRLVEVAVVWLGGMAAKTESRLDDMMIPLVRSTLRVVVIVVALLTAAEIAIDRPISAIIAGLGVGGIAIGLAAQDTLKNFFGSIMLFSDRPFEMGDRVVIDGHDGPVEAVGFRSTRIRTLEGHLVTVPNGELANKTILNIGKRPNIRRLMNITITYDTPPDKVQRATDIIREILDHHEGMDPELPPRVVFNDFKDSALNIMVLYWYHPPDYWAYAEFSERVNFEILRRFNDEGIDFAFPSQSIYLAGDSNRSIWQGFPTPPE